MRPGCRCVVFGLVCCGLWRCFLRIQPRCLPEALKFDEIQKVTHQIFFELTYASRSDCLILTMFLDSLTAGNSRRLIIRRTVTAPMSSFWATASTESSWPGCVASTVIYRPF